MRLMVRMLQVLLLAFVLAGAAWATEAPTELVDINGADAATLDRVLVNVGPAKADAIIAYRRANGPFRTVEQLALVKGIGQKTIERNRDRIVLGTVGPVPRAGTGSAGRTMGGGPRSQLQR